MELKIISATADRAEWDALIERLPPHLRDVHMTSAYGRVQEELGGSSIAAVMEIGSDFVFQSFIKKNTPFDVNRFDLTNPYGFGGPVSNVDAPSDLREIGYKFRSQLAQCLSANVVAEYCCLHPLLADHQLQLTRGLPVIFTKPVIAIDLEKFSEATVRRRVRRGIKTARDLGWVVKEVGGDPVNYLGFAELYRRSMDAKNASQRWRFGISYFEKHDVEVGARWFYIDGHRALLTIGASETAYAHLLGSDGERRDDEMDALLYFQTALALRSSGYKRFHLGGGLTNNLDDSLLAFKSGFSDLRYQVGCYERIYDMAAYGVLTEQKIAAEISERGRMSKSNWFPAYRREFV